VVIEVANKVVHLRGSDVVLVEFTARDPQATCAVRYNSIHDRVSTLLRLKPCVFRPDLVGVTRPNAADDVIVDGD